MVNLHSDEPTSKHCSSDQVNPPLKALHISCRHIHSSVLAPQHALGNIHGTNDFDIDNNLQVLRGTADAEIDW